MSIHDSPAARRQRTFAWIAIALAGLAFALASHSWARGAPGRWIEWVIPPMIVANVGTSTFGLLPPLAARRQAVFPVFEHRGCTCHHRRRSNRHSSPVRHHLTNVAADEHFSDARFARDC